MLPLTPFVYEGDPDTLDARWDTWLMYFESWAICSSLELPKDEQRIKAFFILHLGPVGVAMFQSLQKPDSSDTLKECYELMTNHVRGKRTLMARRFAFSKAERREDERIVDFLLRVRSLARDGVD